MRRDPGQPLQRVQGLLLRAAASVGRDDRADDLPGRADEEQQRHGDGLGRADRAGWEMFRRPPQGSDERCQTVIGYLLAGDNVRRAVQAAQGQRAQDRGGGHEPGRQRDGPLARAAVHPLLGAGNGRPGTSEAGDHRANWGERSARRTWCIPPRPSPRPGRSRPAGVLPVSFRRPGSADLLDARDGSPVPPGGRANELPRGQQTPDLSDKDRLGGAVRGVRADPVAGAARTPRARRQLGLIQRAPQGLPGGCLATTGLTVEPW
jgi:hypothetical protein